mmetsp:Transcript_26245/g.58328  ORF Transcript_26245/g.58328 Transcript_26245/m.58328 type:complete len:475 (-) Transcript_26245:330-1754(-)
MILRTGATTMRSSNSGRGVFCRWAAAVPFQASHKQATSPTACCCVTASGSSTSTGARSHSSWTSPSASVAMHTLIFPAVNHSAAVSSPCTRSNCMVSSRHTKHVAGSDSGAHVLVRTLSSESKYFEGPWYEKYLLLQKYKEKNGSCLVPRSYVDGGVRLGEWVNGQRKLHKKGKLSANRRDMLDSIGFSWDPLADRWEGNYLLLLQYKAREGHCLIPKRHEEGGVKLGKWLHTLRQAKKKGKLDETYQRRLQDAGVSWDPLADQWEKTFSLLKQYKKREGHCNVPQNHEETGTRLGRWLLYQRRAMKTGKLDESYQNRLEEVGVIWDLYTQQWEEKYILLLRYKERKGHCNVPQHHQEGGVQLGSWLQWQRQAKKRGVLESWCQRRLDELGVSWDVLEDHWNATFALLVKYKEREGHCNVPFRHEEDGVRLGFWLHTQRQVKKGQTNGILDADRLSRLNDLGISWTMKQWKSNN